MSRSKLNSPAYKYTSTNQKIYGNQLVSTGNHELKIRMKIINPSSIIIGIAETADHCNSCFNERGDKSHSMHVM